MSHGPGWKENVEGDAPVTGDSETPIAALEAALTDALRPIEPPRGFTERVLAAAAVPRDEPQSVSKPVGAKVLPFRSWRLAVTGALAASVLAGSFVAVDIRGRHVREQAKANRQFETATRITDEALAHTREQLERAGVFKED